MFSAPLTAPRAISGTTISASGSFGVPGMTCGARIEVGAVRPDRRAVRDGPPGQPRVVGGPVVHDLFLVLGRAREHRHELPARVVGLVDVQRLVRA